jgi:hypothetical protein
LAAAVVQLGARQSSFHLAYGGLGFNGLLFIWGTFKKWRPLLQLKQQQLADIGSRQIADRQIADSR